MSVTDEVAAAGVSVVVPVFGQLSLVRHCVASVRAHTDVPLELVLVDNGSDQETAGWLQAQADVLVRFDVNRGFAAGMNAGLARATQPYVVFLNSDTEVPARWASRLCEHLRAPRVGLTVPAVTRAGVPITVRSKPGTDVVVLPPFSQPPSGVVYAMSARTARELGGFCEAYGLGGGEDLDLCFSLWVNGLDIVFDSRVLVDHVSKATASTVFPDWTKHWDRTADHFFEAWANSARNPTQLDTCDTGTFCRNVLIASSVASWMKKYVESRRASRLVGHALVRRSLQRTIRMRRRLRLLRRSLLGMQSKPTIRPGRSLPFSNLFPDRNVDRLHEEQTRESR